MRPTAFANADGVLDFTVPAATIGFAALAAQARLVHVVGTTGLSDDDKAKIKAAARHAVVIQSGNMSLGVNLLAGLVRQAAAALGPEFDIEIVEMHHRNKIDAPSGTALLLGEAAAKGRGIELAGHSASGRHGITGRAARRRYRLCGLARRLRDRATIASSSPARASGSRSRTMRRTVRSSRRARCAPRFGGAARSRASIPWRMCSGLPG